MKTLKYKGFIYSVIIRPWKKGNKKYEVIKRKVGFPASWERIYITEYLTVKNLLKSDQ